MSTEYSTLSFLLLHLIMLGFVWQNASTVFVLLTAHAPISAHQGIFRKKAKKKEKKKRAKTHVYKRTLHVRHRRVFHSFYQLNVSLGVVIIHFYGLRTLYTSREYTKFSASIFEPCHEKTSILVSDLVRHKPSCTATEDC